MTFEGYFVYRKLKPTDIIVLVNADCSSGDDLCDYTEIHNHNLGNFLMMYSNPFSVVGVILVSKDTVKGYVVHNGVLT